MHAVLLALSALSLGTTPLVVTAGMGSSTASTACGRSVREDPPELFQLASELATWPDALRLDGGGMLGATALGDLTIDHDAPGFARSVQALGIRGLVLGRSDLSAPRYLLLKAAQAFQAQHLPFVVSNLVCDRSTHALCDAMVTADDEPFLIPTPEGPVALVAAISPDSLGHMAQERSAGLQLTSPQAAIERATQKARAAGARQVIAFYDGIIYGELEDTLALNAALGKGAHPPDLMVAARLSGYFTSASPPSHLPLVASHPGHALLASPSVQEAPPPDVTRAPESIRRWSAQLSEWLCQTYAGPLHAWRMPVGLDGEGVANLVLDILREQTQAEVAMVNKRSIKTEFIRSADISQLDIMEALPYDNAVVVGRIPGSLLKGYLLGDAVNQRLRFRGLTTDGHGGVQVNGRPLQEDQTYVVVLNDFLARGGDHLITDPTLHFHTRGPATLRQGWTDWLRARTNPGDWAGHYPRDPARMVRWVVRTTADASLSQTRVANPDPTSFTDTQLTQVNAVSLHGDVELRADADHPDFTFENDLMGRYGTARTAASVGLNAPAVYSETDDLIFLRDVASQKRWAGLKSAPYVPLFFGESYLESEFTTPSTRTYHHLEWRPTGGIRFSLLPELSITGAVGFDWETLARDDQMPAHQPSLAAVVVGGIQLRPKQVLKLGPLQLNAEGTLDVEERNFGANRSSLIRFHAKVSLPIWKMLSLTLTYDLFARRYDPEYLMGTAAAANGWSFAGNALVGLAFSWVEPVQTFWF